MTPTSPPTEETTSLFLHTPGTPATPQMSTFYYLMQTSEGLTIMTFVFLGLLIISSFIYVCIKFYRKRNEKSILDENVTGMGINLWGKDEVRDLGGVGELGGGDIAGGKRGIGREGGADGGIMANILEGDKQYMRLRSSTLFDVYRPVDLEREQETINRITSVSLRTFGSPQPSPPVNSLTRGSSLPSLHQTLSIRHPPLSPIGSRRRSESADSNSTTGRKTLRLLRREETLDIVVVDLKEEEEGVEIELEEEDTKEEDKLDVLMIKPSPKNLNRVTMSEDAMADFECPIFKRHNDEDLDETLREARKEQEKKKMFETSVEKGFFFRPSFDDGDL